MNPQISIFSEGSTKRHHLEYKVLPGVKIEDLKLALNTVLSISSEDVPILFAFGRDVWEMIQPKMMPKSLQDFAPIEGKNGHSIPSTQNDVFVWFQSEDESKLVDTLIFAQKSFSEVMSLKLEVSGFVYYDSRDLIGFVDGTGNPKENARVEAAVIPTSEIGAGGSYVLAQKWVHNLDKFKKCDVAEQERIIGRTKVEDIELTGEAMPPDSHVSRTDVKVDGKAMKIWRRSSPFASATEQGLYFLSFSSEIERFEIQLQRMFGLTEDQYSDRLLEFSSAVSSSYFFAPNQEDLRKSLSLG